MFQLLSVLAIIQAMIITSECRPYSWEQEPLGGIVWWVQLSGGTMSKPPEFDEDLKTNIGTITYEVSKDAEPIKFMETTRDFVAKLEQDPHHNDDATYHVLQKVKSGAQLRIGCWRKEVGDNYRVTCNFRAV